MTFAFAAVGSKEDVLGELSGVDVSGDPYGEKLKNLVTELIQDSRADPHSDYHSVVYSVQAIGHSGGDSPFNVSLELNARFTPKPSPLT